MNDWQTQWLEKLDDLIITSLAKGDLSNESLAKELSMSPSSFYRRVQKLTGQTPNHYIRSIRLDKSFELIQSGATETIKEVAGIVGFRKYSYFSSLFKERYGVLPSELSKNRIST